MNAPNRAVEVAAIVGNHRELFGTDDSRRGILYFICTALNGVDDNNWGVLLKTDRDNFIPSDIIVWAPTREHFDALGGDPDRAIWLPLGVITNPAWLWAPADRVKPPLEPPAPPAPVLHPDPPQPAPLPNPEEVLTGAAVLREALDQFGVFIDAVVAMADASQSIAMHLKDGIKVDVKVHL